MNAEAIKKRMEEYLRTLTPEQAVADLEAVGAELVDIPEICEIQYHTEQASSPIAFDGEIQTWLKAFAVGEAIEAVAVMSTDTDSSTYEAKTSEQAPSKTEKSNTQYAMAA